MKRCSRCGLEQPIDNFHRAANEPDGRHCWCKACRKLPPVGEANRRSCKECGELIGSSKPKTQQYCSERCFGLARSRLRNARYIKRTTPGKRGGEYEHRLVWEAHHGPIPEGGVIHHINGDRRDNSIENLQLCASTKEHAAMHKGEWGRWVGCEKPSVNGGVNA